MNLELRNSDDTTIIHTIAIPAQLINDATPTIIEVHLWNRKDGICDYTASNVEVSLVNADKTTSGGSDYEGQEIVTENRIQMRSNGVTGSSIVDDAQSVYTAVGGSTALSIGDIPVACCRHLHVKLQSVTGMSTTEALFFIKVKYNYARTTAYTLIEVRSKNVFFGDYFLGEFL